MCKISVIFTSVVLITWIFFSRHVTAQILDDENDLTNFEMSIQFEAPLIEPHDEDVTLDVGSNFTLRCSSKYPVTWTTLHDPDPTSFIITSLPAPIPDRPYGSTIKLINVNFNHVGYYYCLREETKQLLVPGQESEYLDNPYHSSKIYVFVDDPVNLMVPILTPVASAIQYQEFVVPCKPTSKNVQVELIKAEDESQQAEASFDPKNGFTIQINHLTDAGAYKCVAIRDTANDEQFYHIEVLSNSATEFVSKPRITSHTGDHATEGGKLELNCTVEIHVGVTFTMEWDLPNDNIAKEENRAEIEKPIKELSTIDSTLQIGRSRLIVNNINRAKDQGLYVCKVRDHNNKSNSNNKVITILDPNQGFINMSEPSGRYTIKTHSNRPSVQWIIHYTGYPRPITLTWYDNQGREISSWGDAENKYTVTIRENECIFRIRNIELRDSGEYTLKADNTMVERSITVKLIVEEKPTVNVKDVYVMEHEEAVITCDCTGYPPSDIEWTFTPCIISPKWPTCDKADSVTFGDDQVKVSAPSSLFQQSELRFTPTSPGKITCRAKNSKGEDSVSAEIRVGDIREPLEVWGVDEKNPTSIGDEFSIFCGALVYNFTGPLRWYRGDLPLEPTSDIIVNDSHTDYSYRSTITWKSISESDSGTYECRGNVLNEDHWESKDIDVRAYEPIAPQLQTTSMEGTEMMKNLGESLRLECIFAGLPKPKIKWYKDEQVIVHRESSNSTIELYDEDTVLNIKYIRPEDQGVYKCEGSNKLGSDSHEIAIKIGDMPGLNKGWFIGIGALLLILFLSTIILCVRMRRTRRLLQEMKEAGLANFEEGSPEQINPALALDEQADLLPYDKQFEFPREKLKLGKQLGAGAFGIVVKGVAQGILPYEDETTVAVKMVKKNTDNEVMRALISELKIMVHLGQHLNVVNLLGAVTKNIAKREVMVIVEYCRFGNVQNFLLKHREYFINQINPETDQIDPTILSPEQRWSHDSGYEYNSQGLKYLKLSFSNNHVNNNSKGEERRVPSMNMKKGDGPASHINSKGYLRHSGMDTFIGGMDSCNTEATLISQYAEGGEDNMVLSNNSVQPAWRSNYRMDYKGPARTVTTSDLVCWGFQVARGMDYLASRNILHGDLAARNILLCDDNVVKICDFGLARSMYKSNNYKKQGKALLPFKWLALESISDHVFSTYSDIWSFGIVLWEFFSLAKVPYPGMDADQKFYEKLRDGYRMDKPLCANQEIYDVMLQCWCANPESRPLFSDLEKRLSNMLQESVRDHYVDLNEPYLQMNTEYLKSGQRDYLASMGPPETPAPPVPTYVNRDVIEALPLEMSLQDTSSPNYLQMSPKSGSVAFSARPSTSTAKHHSPTLANNLNTSSPSNQKNRKKPGLPEEIPMLPRSTSALSSDSEPELSPNPSMRERTIPSIDTTDNYVNVPSSTVINMNSVFGPRDAFSNPTYVGAQPMGRVGQP
ncbi:vascular endothelial growth factor receptor 1 isoform X3 [Phlebotomus papatasi]|uniref:vascular endothelial growth factor receptor 1 isoform X3 n=1 Tax=Phlebotomus papatasi TaxID=29031 RepID=UPI002483A440|nr:vascular endothelial growth factor receptor 1 isoform X3 [Phlebotomus papatasi]XP_055710178.1 vascular endothelial growth factor receptor 1 isoform X3 [Phlebotomus papatasi]XP_055710179.1 vascular endothelial growth factor receptor 1 isoform X3 [Phlebotomus papatasi]